MAEKVLYFECFAGLSGDMCLAALLNIGLPETHLRTELSKLGIDAEFELQVSPSQKLGIHGIRVDVITSADHHAGAHAVHRVSSGQDNNDKTHEHVEPSGHAHHHDNDRDYAQIMCLIDQSTLDSRVKARATSIFEELANAEAAIHNVPIDTVHFHEVGATDSIVDIVGAAIGIEYLIEHEGVRKILSSPVELGDGKVKCAHGVYPVPAPATSQILEGVPITKGGVRGEATTPTGAAILKVCVNEFSKRFQGVSLKTVYGIGHRDADIPNVVRLQLLELNPRHATPSSADFEHAKIEANIDDMSPEAFEPLFERLFEAGADDVFLQPITMKKSRSAQLLSVLCKHNLAHSLGEIVLNHSSSIGLRIIPFHKVVLSREIITVPTSVGDISTKIVIQPDGTKRFKSEHDEIAEIARDRSEPYLAIKRRVDAEIETYLQAHAAEIEH